jgi:hypothetical protein
VTLITAMSTMTRTPDLTHLRHDRFVWLIVIAVAAVVALGLATAWFIYCQNSGGGWPALDMPSFQSGGTWKLYCRK